MKTLFSLAALLWLGAAVAQDFPARTVRIIVPFTPSGPVDVVGRVIAERLGARWKVPVIVENRPGGGTVIGGDAVAKAAPDGHTVLLAVTAHAVNATLVRKLPYDTLKDFAPIVLVATAPNILAVHPALPARSVTELIAHAKANPGKLNAATHGKGNTSHLGAEMLRAAATLDFAMIHYKGAQPAVTALVTGEAGFMFDTGIVIPQAQAGKARIIATAGPKRSTLLPEVPTLIEAGLAGFEVVSWYGFLAPAGTPRGALDALNRAINDTLADPEIRGRIQKLNLEPAGGTLEAFDQLVTSQVGRWATVIRAAGIEAD